MVLTIEELSELEDNIMKALPEKNNSDFNEVKQKRKT